MLEEYILIGDGKDGKVYVDVDCVMEALGIKEDDNIFRAIEKLKEDNDLLKELHTNHISQLNGYAELAFELGIESGDAESIKDYIDSLKKERDLFKEKCDKLKTRANVMYGVSRGYSASKEPAFRCDVISYSWKVGSMRDVDSMRNVDSIRVELELTPTANYKGAFAMQDLKKYIQTYGRDKKLGVAESVDYQNAKTARAELAYLYKTVLGKEKLNRDLSPHEVMKAILDEYKRVVHNFEERTADWSKAQQELDRYRLAVGSLCNIPAEHRDDISWIEDAFNNTKKSYLKWQTTADRLARFRSRICTALCLGGETSDEDILKAVEAVMERATELQFNTVDKDEYDKLSDCRDRLYDDYAELRKAIWEAMDRKPETLPEENARLVGEVAELARGEKLLIEFRNAVAKAIGMDYPTTNQVVLNNVKYIYKDRGDAYDIVAKLNNQVKELSKAKDDLQQKFLYQSGLRQQWHVRYESEHERANGVQKALDREREKCRVKDISLETAKKQYEKVCGNLETAECALTGMKSKVRELREEKTKVITALGQDIWDDCVK